MATKPPLKSAQNAPKKLGHSEFTKQHGSVWGYNKPLPKTEMGSPRMDHLVKSAVQIKDLKSEYMGFKNSPINLSINKRTENFSIYKVAKKILYPENKTDLP